MDFFRQALTKLCQKDKIIVKTQPDGDTQAVRGTK